MRFYASLESKNRKAPVTCQGAEGLEGHIRGFHFGVRVSLAPGAEGLDTAHIYLTTGSNGSKAHDVLIGVFDQASFPDKPEGG